jgi:anti-sigma B factor antagonist
VQSVVLEYVPTALVSLEAAMIAALESGAARVVLDLDGLATLDTDGVRGLIKLLRRARAIGGELALQSSKPDVLRTLNVTALDRLFPMVGVQAA